MTIVAPASPRPTAAKVIARHNNEELRILFCVGVGSLFLFKKKREKKVLICTLVQPNLAPMHPATVMFSDYWRSSCFLFAI